GAAGTVDGSRMAGGRRATFSGSVRQRAGAGLVVSGDAGRWRQPLLSLYEPDAPYRRGNGSGVIRRTGLRVPRHRNGDGHRWCAADHLDARTAASIKTSATGGGTGASHAVSQRRRRDRDDFVQRIRPHIAALARELNGSENDMSSERAATML